MERLVLTTTNRCTTRLHPDLLLTADLQFYCSTFAVWLQQVCSLVSPLGKGLRVVRSVTASVTPCDLECPCRLTTAVPSQTLESALPHWCTIGPPEPSC